MSSSSIFSSTSQQRQIVAATAALALVVTPLILSSRTRRIVGSHLARCRLALLSALVGGGNSKTGGGDEEEQPKVTGLFVYPVKSLKGVSVSSRRIDSFGLQDDRRLMIVRPRPAEDGNKVVYDFITQRQAPSLTTVIATLPPSTPTTSDTKDTNAKQNRTITLSSHLVPDKRVEIDISREAITSPRAKQYAARVWDDYVNVVDVGGKEASEFIHAVIKNDDPSFRTLANDNDLRIVSVLPQPNRTTDERYVPLAAYRNDGTPPSVTLPDEYPILLTFESSLQELNRRLRLRGKKIVTMNQFRPNIVVTNTKPFEEDAWKAIQIGKDAIIHVCRGADRCKESCTDQETGSRSEEPLETLREFRQLGETECDVYFGSFAVVQGKGGVINVGDKIKVLTRGDPVWKKP